MGCPNMPPKWLCVFFSKENPREFWGDLNSDTHAKVFSWKHFWEKASDCHLKIEMLRKESSRPLAKN